MATEKELEEMITMAEMVEEMRKLFIKGQTNPSAVSVILGYKGYKGRFMEIRKIAEYQYKMYCIEEAKKKRE